MSGKSIWIIESLDKDGIYGTFSTKGKALNAIEIWANGVHKYDIITNLKKFKRRSNTPILVNIKYRDNERLVALYIRRYLLNNGAGMCHVFRQHFGVIDENEIKENS
jgi:hypothetical protein